LLYGEHIEVLFLRYRQTPRAMEVADEKLKLELRIFPGPLVQIRKSEIVSARYEEEEEKEEGDDRGSDQISR
jgi:hypothetical protein